MPRLTRRSSLVATLVVVLGGTGCNIRVGPPVRPLGNTEYTLTSAAFVAEYKANMSAAINKYGDRVVELTGKLGTIGDRDAKPVFFLEGPDPKGLDRAICMMTDRFPWARANPGQTVTLKGRGTRKYLVPRLENCEIVSVRGDPLPHLTADEFAQRTNDPDLKKRRPGDYTYCIVRGEVERYNSSLAGIILKTKTPKPGALIHFTPDDAERLGVKSWKPGTQIEVIGGDSTNPKASYAWLVNAILMADPK
jgi:hypothetical protein